MLASLLRNGSTAIRNANRIGPRWPGASWYVLGREEREVGSAAVADRFYVAPSQELFDEAVMWLGQQLGQVEVEPVVEKGTTKTKKTKGKTTKE